MKKRSILAISLCLLLSTAGFSQSGKSSSKVDLSQEMKLESTVRYGKLDNGMTYYVKSNKKPENRAEFYLAVNAGSVLEEEDQLGLAHFTEHMGFNGTLQFPGNDLTDALQKEGITFGRDDNAYTSFDQTVYQLTLPTDKPELFNLGLKVLGGWASGMLMTDSQIDDERGVIIEEWRLGQGASDRMRQKTWPIILKGSKYADRLPIGTVENLKNFKYSSIRNFYKKWYRPDNQAVIVVGDFDADEMVQKIKDYFSMTAKPDTPLVRPEESIPDNKEPLIAVATDKEATSSSILVLYKQPVSPMKTVGDFRNKELMVNIYETMLANRFNELSQKKGCPFVGAQSGFLPSFIARNVGGYVAMGNAKDGKILETLKVLMEENQRVLQHGFLSTEFERAKESVLEQYERASKEANKTNSSTFAAQYVDNFLEGTPAVGARQEYRWAKALIDGVTLDEVNALAKNWITKDNIIAYVTMPERKDLKVPTTDQIKKIILDAENMKTKPYVDTYKEVPFFAENVKAGKVEKEVKNDEFGFTEWTMSNGAKVILKPSTFKDNEILMQSWSNGGSSLYPDDILFNVQLAATIIDGCGIGQMDHNQLSKFQQKHSFGTTPYISDLREGINGNCTPKDFELLLQYTYMYFTSPRKDKEVLDVRIENLRSQLKQIQNSPEVAFQLQLNKSMYPNDKRSITIPTEKQINSLNIDKMYKIFRERFNNASDFTFEFVGNFDINEVKPLIEKYIGGLPSTGKTEQWKDVSPKFAKGVVDDAVYKGTDDKATLVLIMNKDFVNDAKEKRTVDIMGEILQIKVTEKIREELGATYSPYLGVDYSLEPTPEFTMTAYYTCAPDNVAKVEDATWEILDDMINNGTDEVNLAKAKEQLIKRRESQYSSSNNFWASVIQQSYIHNIKIANMEEFKDLVNSITADEVKAIAAKYLKHNEYVKVQLLPETLKK
ncbi:MAG: insulinase family protein [Bacteroidales bacterium]|nr:insulinase family protein [Bacteroidales bacterium]